VLRRGDAALEEAAARDAVPAAAPGPEHEPLAAEPLPSDARTLQAFPEPEPEFTPAAVAEPAQTPATESTSTLPADPGLAEPVVAPAPPVQAAATPGVVRFVAVAPQPAVVTTATVSLADLAVPSVPAPPIIVVPTGGSHRPEPAAEPAPSPGVSGHETAAAEEFPATAAKPRHGGATDAPPALFAWSAHAAPASQQPPRPVSAIPAVSPLGAPPAPAVHSDSGKLALSAMFQMLTQAGTRPRTNPAPDAPHGTHLSGQATAARGLAGNGEASRS
jgi:hypothetical protein